MTAAPRSHRRNAYLVDRAFQLKYTGLLLALTAIIALPLAYLVHSETREALRMANAADEAAKVAIEQVDFLNARLEEQTIIRYDDDPQIVEATRKSNKKARARIDAVESTIVVQQAALAKREERLRWILAGGFALLVAIVGAAGIYFTHRVAGPIQRMRGIFRDVVDGRATRFRPLRKTDDLQDFFLEFWAMVNHLRERQRLELERLDRAIEKAAAAGVRDASLVDLRVARDAMQQALDEVPSERQPSLAGDR